ncbi:WGR domain-containing protein [Burkholderia anthina]|uniref:WGR domain-containing protein n=1 Tax=Burkholderia anthina TaxID=179879 RepID=UPI00158F61CB|nr:WGR domain-containing protein [Burkholderia anthina]
MKPILFLLSSGHALSSPLLKATVKKQVFIPTYTRHDGVVVPGHYSMVHVADDHDDHKVIGGNGSSSQKTAHAKLSKHDWWHALPHDHKVGVLLEHATEIQDKASAAGVLSTFKKKVLAGQSPSPSEWKVFVGAAPEKQKALLSEFDKAGKGDAVAQGVSAHLAKNPATVAPAPISPDSFEPPKPAQAAPVAVAPEGKKPAQKVVAAAEKSATPPAAAHATHASSPALQAHVEAIVASKLPDSNVNAKAVNPKLQAIADATAKGDVKTLLMMGYGTNTYGKKAAKLANESLALLGSQHTVAPGQKMASHTALKGAGAAAAPATAAVSTAAAPVAASSGAAEAKPNAEKRAPAAADADGMGGWDFEAVDPVFSGYPSIAFGDTSGTGDPAAYIVKVDDEYQALYSKTGDITDDTKMEHADFATPHEAADWLANHGVKVPKAALQAIGGAAYEPPEEHVAGQSGTDMSGPKEGDTKQGEDGMLVFKDGRWHKVGADKPYAAAAASASTDPVMSHVYEHTTDGHDKFWAVAVDGSHMSVAWGKNGTAGQKKVKAFASPAAAEAEMAKLVKEKTAKGYVKQYSEPIDGFAPGGAPAAAATPKPAAPAPKKAAKVVGAAVSSAAAPESMDGWKKVGEQKGFNQGGTYLDAAGVEWYCKFPSGGENVIKNEVLAQKLYALAGVDTAETKLVMQGGKLGIASKIVPGAKQDKEALLAGKAAGLLSGFGADAWLANWDTVGNNPAAGKGFDNILIKPDGSAVRIDAGGAMIYGGAGGKKQAFGDNVIELKTMLDPKKNKNTAAVFGKMAPADIAASVSKVIAIPDSAIEAAVLKYGPGSMAERQRLAAKLIARKADMLAQYPLAAKGPAKKAAATAFSADLSWVKLKPGEKVVEHGKQFGGSFAKIEVPAKGFNAEGIPKPYKYDKSSSSFVNEVNTADIQSVYDKALETHDPAAVAGMKFAQIDKATGTKSGKMLSVDEHPSKAYVKEYVNQVAAELKAQTEPTYRIEHRGGFTSSYSAAAAEIAAKVKTIAYSKFAKWANKAADYLVLDKQAGSGIPTPPADSFHDVEPTDPQMVAFKNASDAQFNKLTASEQAACEAYTGNAYWKWNSAMRLGAVDSAEFKAGEPMRKAFAKAAVELPDGIVLHRGLNVGGDTYKSVIGAVIQDGSFQSSSYGKKAAFSGMSSQLRLNISKGVKGMMATSFSKYGHGEREIILHPNCRYVVTGVQTKNGQNIVDVLVLPHEG